MVEPILKCHIASNGGWYFMGSIFLNSFIEIKFTLSYFTHLKCFLVYAQSCVTITAKCFNVL